MHDIKETAREKGYVETIFGRRRAIPEIKSSNFDVRSGAERIALNTPVQGSAADIIKLAWYVCSMRSRGCRPGCCCRCTMS